MNAMNQIILEGNVVRQPEKRTLPSGTSVCSLPIAVNRRYKSSTGEVTEEVSFFDVETYGSLADNCARWCPKGRNVFVIGRLKQNRWQDEDGKNHSRIAIVAAQVDFRRFPKDAAPLAPAAAAPAEPAPRALTKKQKLALLAQAAAAAQSEQEAGEIAF